MAVDDVTTVLSANLGDASAVDRQPSSGVEEMLLDVGSQTAEGTLPDIVPAVEIKRIVGTDTDAILLQGDSGNMATVWFRMKMIADNTNYFRFTNRGGAAGDLTFAVIAVG